jgi:formylmethanofuran dehydrogenase subunit E
MKTKFKELLETSFKFNGHKCPAIPLGIRTGLTALKKLGVEDTSNKELYCIAETGPVHAMHCFVDGVQVSTACTFGEGNFEKTNRGKLAFTLIDVKDKKSVRIVVKPKLQKKLLDSEFMKLRSQGVKSEDIDFQIVNPLIQMVITLPDNELMTVGKIKETDFKPPKGTFNLVICEECGEGVFENAIRYKNGKFICKSCFDSF